MEGIAARDAPANRTEGTMRTIIALAVAIVLVAIWVSTPAPEQPHCY